MNNYLLINILPWRAQIDYLGNYFLTSIFDYVTYTLAVIHIISMWQYIKIGIKQN